MCDDASLWFECAAKNALASGIQVVKKLSQGEPSKQENKRSFWIRRCEAERRASQSKVRKLPELKAGFLGLRWRHEGQHGLESTSVSDCRTIPREEVKEPRD